MAKYCGSCGARLEDNARVCGQCGTPVEGIGGKIPNFEVDDPVKKAKAAKRVKAIVILAVLAIVVVVGVRTVLSFTGANGVVRKVMAAYKDYDIDALVDLSSDVYYYSLYEDFAEDYFENIVGSTIDDFESSVGHSYKFSYEVEEIYDLSERRQEEIRENIEYLCPDFDIDTISKFAVAEIKITAKQGSKSSSSNVSITMSKENGDWKILYLG